MFKEQEGHQTGKLRQRKRSRKWGLKSSERLKNLLGHWKVCDIYSDWNGMTIGDSEEKSMI